MATEKKNKILKSLTLPGSIAKELEKLAKTTGCKQADLVRIALCELIKLNDEQLNATLTEYQLI